LVDAEAVEHVQRRVLDGKQATGLRACVGDGFEDRHVFEAGLQQQQRGRWAGQGSTDNSD
jgi:hypothetical protein